MSDVSQIIYDQCAEIGTVSDLLEVLARVAGNASEHGREPAGADLSSADVCLLASYDLASLADRLRRVESILEGAWVGGPGRDGRGVPILEEA